MEYILFYSLITLRSNRLEGDWNRSLLSGMSVLEFFIANLIQCNIVAAILTLQMLLFSIFVLEIEPVASYWLISWIVFRITCWTFLVGVITTIFFEKTSTSGPLAGFLTITFLFISGLLW